MNVMTWAEAENFCGKTMGKSFLTSIGSSEENEEIRGKGGEIY